MILKLLLILMVPVMIFGQNNKFNPGDAAPDFTLFDQDGKAHTLSDYLGQNIVIYFYPKDDTPG